MMPNIGIGTFAVGYVLLIIPVLVVSTILIDRYSFNGFVIAIVVAIAWLIGGLAITAMFFPPIHHQPTGEIVKMYINGSALLDNGTVVKMPFVGCP